MPSASMQSSSSPRRARPPIVVLLLLMVTGGPCCCTTPRSVDYSVEVLYYALLWTKHLDLYVASERTLQLAVSGVVHWLVRLLRSLVSFTLPQIGSPRSSLRWRFT